MQDAPLRRSASAMRIMIDLVRITEGFSACGAPRHPRARQALRPADKPAASS
jgi:hypothetical protein